MSSKREMNFIHLSVKIKKTTRISLFRSLLISLAILNLEFGFLVSHVEILLIISFKLVPAIAIEDGKILTDLAQKNFH